jgi:hypothetical protein
MRIVISAPRKSGGAHLRCLLSMAYDLKAPPVSAPEPPDQEGVATWMSELPDRSVSTCDLPLSMLNAPARDSGVLLIGVIRHPFDLFVSNYDVAQQRAARGRQDVAGGPSWGVLVGADLSGEIAQEYAAHAFAAEVAALREWFASGWAVRFEDLLGDPASALRSLSPILGPLMDEAIHHAVGLCPPENVVVSRPGQGRRMPALPPGAWRERLPASLVAILQARYSGDVRDLGYDAS